MEFPARYGSYLLLARLGHGGMAEVFLARKAGPGGFSKLVVIKRILDHLSHEAEFVQMFLDEARLAAQLEHPNIAQLFNIGEVDGALYIEMEYLAGQTLAEIASRSKQTATELPPFVAARIVADAGQGLHYAHEFKDASGAHLGIVHRDVSPHNLFVTYDGRVKLLDFGVAKAATQLAQTRAGSVKGKLSYMSPEQCRGEPVDARSDIFALGIILFELVSGRRLFRNDDELALIRIIGSGDFPDLHALGPAVPPPLMRVCERALTFKREDRYASARLMKAELDAYLKTIDPEVNAERLAQWMGGLFGAEIDLRNKVVVAREDNAAVFRELQDRSRDSFPSLGALAGSGTRTAMVAPPAPLSRSRAWPRFAWGLAAVVALSGLGAGALRWGAREPPVPPGCADLSRAGLPTTHGDTEAGAIHLGALMNITSLTGVTNENKVRNIQALMMAVDEMNTLGGTGEHGFTLHICDTANDGSRLKAQLGWLIQRYHVPAAVVAGSTQVIAAASVSLPAGVLLISPTATSPDLASLPKSRDGHVPLIWRTAPSDTLQGRVMADLLLAEAGPSRVGLIYSGESYGQGLESVIADRLEAASDGGGSVMSFEYPLGGDVAQAVHQLARFKPERTVLIGLSADAIKILNSAAAEPALSVDAGNRWLFSDAIKDPSFLTGVSDAWQVEGALGTAPAERGGAAYPAFADHYLNRYNADPGGFGFTSHSYDAMFLLGLAASYAASTDPAQKATGARMAAAFTRLSDPNGPVFQLGPRSFIPARSALLARTINVEGTSGKLDFDSATGDVFAPIEVWTVRDGGFQTLRTVEPPRN